MVDTGQGVYPGLQRLEDAPLLLKGFVILHGGDLFLLAGIHHDILLIGGYLIQGEDRDHGQSSDLLLLSDVECIPHFAAVHLLFDGADHLLPCDDEDHLLLHDVTDHLLQHDDAGHLLQHGDIDHLQDDDTDHLLQCDDADHLLQCDGVGHLLLCGDIDHHHLLDGGDHSHLDDADLLSHGIGHLRQRAEYHQPYDIDQTPPCNPRLPSNGGMVVELLNTLHLRCDVDLLFLVREDLQVSPHRGLLEMDGVLSLQFGVYLHLLLGKILQDTKEVLCSLQWGDTEHKKDCHLRLVSPLVPWGLYEEIKVAELINHKIQCPLLRSLRFDLYLQKEGVRPALEVEDLMSAL